MSSEPGLTQPQASGPPGTRTEAESRLHAILDCVRDIAWLKSCEGRYLAVNEAFSRSCGLAASSIPGRTDFDLWPSVLAERYREADREVLRTGEHVRVEEPLQDAEGQLVWLETIRSPLRGPDGSVTGTVGIARDVSERRRVAEQLASAREELEQQLVERTARLEDAYDELVRTQERERLAVRAGRTAVWDADLATGEVYAGPGLAQLLGAEHEDALPATVAGWGELLAASDPGAVDAFLAAFRAGSEGEAAVEHRILHRDGSLRWFLTRGEVLRDPDGRASRLVGTSTDVTALRRADLVTRLLLEADQRVLRREPIQDVLRFLAEELAAGLDLPFVRIAADGGGGGAAVEAAGGPWAATLANAPEVAGLLDRATAAAAGPVLVSPDGPMLAALPTGAPAASGLLAPLSVGGRVLGALAAFGTRPSSLGEPERGLLARVADQVALSLVDSGHLEQLELLTAALEAAANAVVIADAAGRVEWVNRAFSELTGLAAADVAGRPDASLVEPGTGQLLAALRDGRVFREEKPRTRADGTVYVEDQTVTPVRGADGSVRHLIAIRQDVTSRRRDEERLRHLANHDPLTDLPNRQVAERTLERVVSRARRGIPGTLVLIDVDRFKAINDSLGHAAGDQVLVELARFLAKAVRPGDEVARLGDDEFVVVLDGIPAEGGKTMAERLRREVDARRLTIGDRSLDITVSLGVVPVDGRLDVPTTLALADAALAAAKERGRNRVVVFDDRSVELDTLAGVGAWVSRIKDAVRLDRFVLLYQPICSLGTRLPVHHEALLRLADGDGGGLVGTSSFLPVAERFGLMPQIDAWVVEKVVTLLERRPGVDVFVNVSGATLGHEQALAAIVERVRRSRIAPGQLSFEITESTAAQDVPAAVDWMWRLKELGCRFALDDFGIGFSSFAYLQTLPADFVKVDGSFIRDLGASPANRALVKAIVDVARALGKEPIAEWVEELSILPLLAALGVGLGQGFALGRPVREIPPEPQPEE